MLGFATYISERDKFFNLQGDKYVSKQFEEVLVRLCIDSENFFFYKKRLLRYIPFKSYKTDFFVKPIITLLWPLENENLNPKKAGLFGKIFAVKLGNFDGILRKNYRR